MKIQRKSLFCSGRGWISFSSCNSYGGILPTAASLLRRSAGLSPAAAHLGLRGGLAVPAECSADYQHPAIDDLFPPEPLCAVAGLGQAPLRLLFMQPSLLLGLWLIQAAGVRHVAILAGFLLLSEGLKIASLWYCRGGIQGIKR